MVKDVIWSCLLIVVTLLIVTLLIVTLLVIKLLVVTLRVVIIPRGQATFDFGTGCGNAETSRGQVRARQPADCSGLTGRTLVRSVKSSKMAYSVTRHVSAKWLITILKLC